MFNIWTILVRKPGAQRVCRPSEPKTLRPRWGLPGKVVQVISRTSTLLAVLALMAPVFPLSAQETAPDTPEPGSVEESMLALMGRRRARRSLWFAGHRPVGGRYALRAGGRFVQFHDPSAFRVVFLLPGRAPDPDRDIYDIRAGN